MTGGIERIMSYSAYQLLLKVLQVVSTKDIPFEYNLPVRKITDREREQFQRNLTCNRRGLNVGNQAYGYRIKIGMAMRNS